MSGAPDVPANVVTTAALDADGAAQIASSNCEAYVLTQRRVGDRLWKHLGDLSDLTSTQRECS
jgi:hypothetical protein